MILTENIIGKTDGGGVIYISQNPSVDLIKMAEELKIILVAMKQCAFYNTKGVVFDIEPLKEKEMRVIDADLSANFDGSLFFESLERTQDLFKQIDNMNSDKNYPTPESQPSATEVQKQSGEDIETEEVIENNRLDATPDSTPEMLEPTEDPTPKSQQEPEHQPEDDESKQPEKLQQQLKSDKQLLAELRSQLKQVEERIKQARKTNIFGRKQSGANERERDELMAQIKETKNRIAQNESAIDNLQN